jgi:flagellar biosynthetic protein FliR
MMMADFPLLQWFSPKPVLVFILINTRLTGLFITSPVFKNPSFPVKAKLFFSVMVGFLFFTTIGVPLAFDNTSFMIPSSVPELIILMGQELIIGLALGFAVNLMMDALNMAGELVSLQSGLNSAQQYDPLTGQSSPILGNFLVQFGLMLFLTMGLHHWLIGLISQSYQFVPLGDWFTPAKIADLVQRLLFLTSQLWVLGLMLSAPVQAVMLMSEVSLAFVAKLIPQMNVFAISLSLKIALAFWALTTFLNQLEPFLLKQFEVWGHWWAVLLK